MMCRIGQCSAVNCCRYFRLQKFFILILKSRCDSIGGKVAIFTIILFYVTCNHRFETFHNPHNCFQIIANSIHDNTVKHLLKKLCMSFFFHTLDFFHLDFLLFVGIKELFFNSKGKKLIIKNNSLCKNNYWRCTMN